MFQTKKPGYAETKKEMKGCIEVFDEHGDKFIPFLEEDIDDYMSELWSAFYGPQISVLPKKGDLVVYNPQGHLEYKHLNLYNHPPPKDPSTDVLQPQIICRVEHVQLFIKEAGDDICSHITLHPEPEVNSEEKQLGQSDEIEGWIWDQCSRTATKSTRLFSKILRFDSRVSRLYIPSVVATELFHLDMLEMNGEPEVTAKDFHGNEWKFLYTRILNFDDLTGYYELHLETLRKKKNLMPLFRIVFLRDKDTRLRFGIRTYPPARVDNILVDNTLYPVTSAILNKSTFSVIYMPSCIGQEFLIPYQKYMRSIIIWSQHHLMGAQLRKSTGDFIHKPDTLCECVILPNIVIESKVPRNIICSDRHRDIGEVTGMSDLDPGNWPNSKWRCLKVTWNNIYTTYRSRVSPWEIVLDYPYSLAGQQDNSSSTSHLEKDNYLLSDEAIGLEKQTAEPQTSSQLPPTHPFDIEKQTSESQTSSQLLPTHPLDGYTTNRTFDIEKQTPELQTSIEKQTPEPQTSSQLPPTHPLDIEKQTSESQTSSQLLPTQPLDGYTTNHPFDIEKQTPELQTSIEKQTPEPQTSSQLTPFTDSCSLTSSSKSKSTTNDKELKLCNCSVDDFWHHVKGNCSLEYLEFVSCMFSLSACYPLPTTLKKLKITNCVDAEHVFSVLKGRNQSIESLEIYSCPSFGSMPTGGIPATLRKLKIVNCGNLKSLREAFMTKKCSTFERFYYKAGTLELRKLEIENCRELEFLPEGLHELRNLDILSIKNCDSIRYFPSGGLPRTCLTSLSISGCHHLKCLPNQLHEVTSMLNLTICGCPYLMNLPEGGLPRSLVSLSISKCQNFIPLCKWGLHHLEHLERYSFRGGCLDT